MGLLGDVLDKSKGFYKKAFSLYKTDEGKLGLQVGCDLVASGACTAALGVKAALDAKKQAKKDAKAAAKAAKQQAQLDAGDAPEVEELATLRVVTVAVVALVGVALIALSMRRGKA